MGAVGTMVPLSTGTGDVVDIIGEFVTLGTGIGETAGVKVGIDMLGAGMGERFGAVDGNAIAGAAIGTPVGAAGEVMLGAIVGALVSSMKGTILEGDGAIDNVGDAVVGRILANGAVAGALLGIPGTTSLGVRTESNICTIPLHPSIFVASAVALSYLTGSTVTVTKRPESKVSISPATAASRGCNPGSTW